MKTTVNTRCNLKFSQKKKKKLKYRIEFSKNCFSSTYVRLKKNLRVMV